TINNSTISGNTLGTVNFGGGIYADGTVTITSSTIADNGAVVGGGLYVPGAHRGVTTLFNTIIANNSATGTGDDVFGRVNSLGNNLIGSSAGSSGWDGSDILNQNANLGPLQNNGGPTQTHALHSGSPAINGGNNGVLGGA